MADTYGHAAAIKQVILEGGQTCTVNGVTVNCFYGDRTDGGVLGWGGVATELGQTLVVLTEDFETNPALGDTVVIDGKTLSVDSVQNDPCGEFLVLTLNDPTKGV